MTERLRVVVGPGQQSAAPCPQCGKPMLVRFPRKITRRDGGRLVSDVKDFCSLKCGGDYQMGCEG